MNIAFLANPVKNDKYSKNWTQNPFGDGLAADDWLLIKSVFHLNHGQTSVIGRWLVCIYVAEGSQLLRNLCENVRNCHQRHLFF